MKNKVRIYYDDDPDSVVSKINDLLSACGLEIIYSDAGEGWQDYELLMHDQNGDDVCED